MFSPHLRIGRTSCLSGCPDVQIADYALL